MQLSRVLAILSCSVFCTLPTTAIKVEQNPISKAIELLKNLEAKVVKDAETALTAYKGYFEWCDDTARDAANDLKTASAKKEEKEALIVQLQAEIESASSKVEDLGSSMAADEADLKQAGTIREAQSQKFQESEADLLDVIDTLSRATSILNREISKNPAAFAQLNSANMDHVVDALKAVVDAAGFASSDQQKLVALVQSHQQDEEDDGELGAPDVAAYKSHSTGIADVLEDLKEKAEEELSQLRKEESKATHDYKMLKQSLTDQLAQDEQNMAKEKARIAAAEEDKGAGVGDLAVAEKEVKGAKEALSATRSGCMKVAGDHEFSMQARAEEVKVIKEAIKTLVESTSGAQAQTYSFVQVATSSSMTSKVQVKASNVMRMVNQLAKKHHSLALSQLASRIKSLLQFGAQSGDDPFGKVKTLIQDLISKLETEAQEEAEEKAYCDEEMAKTKEKKEELAGDIAKLKSKIDTASSRAEKLTDEVSELQAALARLAKEQEEMDKVRTESHSQYLEAKANNEQGIAGIRRAMTVLREYYGSKAAGFLQDSKEFADLLQQPSPPVSHSKSEGAGSSIIQILELAETDIAKDLAKEETEEADAQAEYEKITHETKLRVVTMEQDIKYKSQEISALQKSISDLSADKENLDTELAAVNQYWAKLTERCIAKPEQYAERKKRRDAEIAGLKEALQVLTDETAFVQRRHRGGSVRGSLIQ